MTPEQRAAMEQARTVLMYVDELVNTVSVPNAINALTAALEQPAQQEPVAIADGTFNHNCPIGTPLYNRPQAREWVGLTDEEMKPLCAENHIIFGAYTVDFILAIEAKLREKNK